MTSTICFFLEKKKASSARLRDCVLVFRCDGVSAMVWCLFVLYVCLLFRCRLGASSRFRLGACASLPA